MERKRIVKIDASKLPTTVEIIVGAQVPSKVIPENKALSTVTPVNIVKKGPISTEKVVKNKESSTVTHVDKEPTSIKKVVINKEPSTVTPENNTPSTVTHVDKEPSTGRVILTTIEIAALALLGYLGYQAWENQNDVNAEVLNKLATLNAPGLVTPGVLPIFTPTFTPTESPTATTTPTPEAPKPVERMTEWSNFWPDTAKAAAAMFGGQASDWIKNPDWTGDKKVLSLFYQKDYFPTEWRPANPENPSYYWPKTQEEAVTYFFPGQDLDPSWLRQNQYGGWELMQDHWIDGYPVDMTATIRPGVVAEGYTVNGDDVAENDRNFVAWGGKNDGVNGGIALPLVNGQGMTLWPPGTDPNKIAIEGKPYNIPYYTGPNGEQLGPDAINFTPIYNAPGFDIISAAPQNHKYAIHLGGGQLAKMTQPPTERHADAFQKNPFKGNRNIYRA